MSVLPGTCHFLSDVMLTILPSLSRKVTGFNLREGCGYGSLPVFQDFVGWSMLLIMGISLEENDLGILFLLRQSTNPELPRDCCIDTKHSEFSRPGFLGYCVLY